MLDTKRLYDVDLERMFEIYDKWPEMAQSSYDINVDDIELKDVTHVVFAGMGGSGALSDIFASVLSQTGIHVDIVKGYLLPKTVTPKSIVIATSISGNTQETLNVLTKAAEIKCKIYAFSSGGKMRELCQKMNINYHHIQMVHSPRSSFPIFLFTMLKILQSFLPVSDISYTFSKLDHYRSIISSTNLTESNPALELASHLDNIPVIYYPWGLRASAIRFKNSLQENAKMHVITEDVIEACHNGIVSWSVNTSLRPIMIRGVDDYIKTSERFDILGEFFDMHNIEYDQIYSVSGDIFTKLINLIYLLDYTSIYRAILAGVDPTPVEPIEFVKKKLVSDEYKYI